MINGNGDGLQPGETEDELGESGFDMNSQIPDPPIEDESDSPPGSNFECNICFDPASEPCVTSCGHLFCWPCIWKWMNSSSHRDQVCPVCKSGITESNIIPIYGRGRETRPRSTSPTTENIEEEEEEESIPQRPRGERTQAEPNPNYRPQNMPFDPFQWLRNNDGRTFRRMGGATFMINGNITNIGDFIRGFFPSSGRTVYLRARHCLSCFFVCVGIMILLYLMLD